MINPKGKKAYMKLQGSEPVQQHFEVLLAEERVAVMMWCVELVWIRN